MFMGLQGCWAIDGHGMGEVVAAEKTVEKEKKCGNGKNKLGADCLPNLHIDLLFLNAWNTTLFIKGGRGTSCLYYGQNLGLWFKQEGS